MAARHPARSHFTERALGGSLRMPIFRTRVLESSRYPLIEELSARDPVFLQYSDDVAFANGLGRRDPIIRSRRESTRIPRARETACYPSRPAAPFPTTASQA